ncbi:transposase [Roseofilum capinflatum]|uniref:Transposase IS4-like domain-containing protein n=1 Tax=Roseofilum capinflatum BLCC-M114 TaxID=3022440 RepID=A0ABT7BCI3_9CYAN|nr:transposase [Roseofilum capinflatum]MDJ1176003.1 hypothetical protein [Roseofilum capinflatum BLCC-M114]
MIDKYCDFYRNLFSDVRSYEAFKELHVGILSDIKRKTLPGIAQINGLKNAQGLYRFLTQSPWKVSELRERRIERLIKALKGSEYMVAIRSNHGVWLPPGARVRANRWRKFERIMSDEKKEIRYVREIIFGQRGKPTYWEVTTDPQTLPDNSTSFVMSNIPHLKYSNVGNIYGERTWVEYGFRQCKHELGWADFRLTHYPHIERWWEMICTAYLLVTLMAPPFISSASQPPTPSEEILIEASHQHPHWDSNKNWKSGLNNLRLLLLPLMCFNLILSWLEVFPIGHLSLGFPRLISLINLAGLALFPLSLEPDFLFFSA